MTMANAVIQKYATDRSVVFDTPAHAYIDCLIRSLNRSLTKNQVQTKDLSELQEIHTTRKRR